MLHRKNGFAKKKSKNSAIKIIFCWTKIRHQNNYLEHLNWLLECQKFLSCFCIIILTV